MKKIIILIVFFSLFSNYLFAQISQDSTKVSFVTYWSIGDRFDFKISYKTESKYNNKPSKPNTDTFLANLTVLDSSRQGYTLRWTYKKPLFSSNKLTSYFMEDLSAFRSIIYHKDIPPLIYTVSEMGEILEISNWEELNAAVLVILKSSTIAMIKKHPKKKEQYIQDYKAYSHLIDTEDGFLAVLLKDLSLVHNPLGYEYEIGKVNSTHEELLSPFGNKNIMGTSVSTIKDIDYVKPSCTLTIDTSSNQKSVKGFILQAFDKLGKTTRETEETIKGSKINIHTSNTYSFLFNPGVPQKIEFDTVVIFHYNNGNLYKKVVQISIELMSNNQK